MAQTSASVETKSGGERVGKTSGKATTFSPAQRVTKFTAPTVWHEFTPLAASSKAVNLGQGFPGWSPPDFVKTAGADSVMEKGCDFMVNQYERSAGRMSLIKMLARKYGRPLGREIDPLREICITMGATNALCDVMLGVLNPGDEVVVFEPAFDVYLAQSEMCGAVLKTVPLRVQVGAGGKRVWTCDTDELKRAFSPKTRMFLLNTPHNPTGKVFTLSELREFAAIVQSYPDVVVVADEVYEHLIFGEHKHISIASLPGMWERTVTISSAGKTFSTTGWKIGWTVGPEHLVRCVAVAHQWVAFSVASCLQEAISRALEEAEKPYQGHSSYYAWLQAEYARKRQIVADALTAAGIEPVMPEGSFFIVGDTSKLDVPAKYREDKTAAPDWQLCRWLTVDIGVAAIPPSSFYCDQNKLMAKDLARFAFCKPDDVLHEAAKRLLKLRDFHKKSS